MIHSCENFCDGTCLEYDICVIGSGPAAFSFALTFLKQTNFLSTRVAILESSAQNQTTLTSNDVQNLYEGELTGWVQTHDKDYLTKSRFRGYGGTSNTWSGWCWPYESFDLEERSIRPGFNWPISFEELTYYSRKAQIICDLNAFEYDNPEYWIRQISWEKLATMPLKNMPLRTRILQFNPIGFHDLCDKEIKLSPQIDVYRNANFIKFETSASENNRCTVEEAVIRTIENNCPGRHIRFKAKYFVLAAGAIETTRLLLLSNIGNSTKQLGRNFIEHPYLWVAAKFQLNNIPEGIKNFYFPNQLISTTNNAKIVATLVPTQKFIEAEKIGSFRILLGGREDLPGTLNVNWEQMPNLNSQISLSDNLPPDLFGQKRVKIDLQISDVDRKTIKILIETAKDVLKRLGYVSNFVTPNMEQDPWSWKVPDKIVPGNHPMGTTRMSINPANGVVDANCLVHDTNNLYVSSSSTFPTGGYVNPTLTIVALSVRLADHLIKLHL